VLLEQDATAPAPYRFRRLALWSKVAAPPPANEGRTQLPPPAPQVHQALEELKSAESWLALVNTAEPKLSQFRFWVDINRYVAEALLNLGEPYQRAQDAVCQETAILMQRIPELVELQFSDGMPFADGATRQWLQTISIGSDAIALEAPTAEAGNAGGNVSDPLAEAVDKAQSLIKKKKLVEAVSLLQDQLPQLRSGYEKLKWRMALCHTLVASKRIDLARPHLDLILKDMAHHDLEQWDPALALQAYKLVWSGFKRQTQKALQQQAEEIIGRIAQLDPTEALRLSKKK
jgi:type VI secretion system protein VasJ